jgi:signal transduction histidine kinase
MTVGDLAGESAAPDAGRRIRPWELSAIVAVVLTALFGGYELAERTLLIGRVSMETLHRLHLVRGIVAALTLAAAIAAYVHNRLPGLATPARPGSTELIDREERRRQYAHWFVNLRWAAIAVSLTLIILAVQILDILPSPTLVPLAGWWIVLVVANYLFGRWVKRGRGLTLQILVQGAVDLVVLTGFLNASGGLENPLYTLYLVHVIIGGILLPKRHAAGLTLLAAALFMLLAFGEYLHVLPHYTIELFPHESALPSPGAHGAETHVPDHGEHASHDIYFVLGRSLPFVTMLMLVAYFTAMIMTRLRRSEYHLEDVARRSMLDRRRLEGVVDASGFGMMQVGPEAELRWFSRRIVDWFDWRKADLGSTCPLLESDGGCPECIAKRTVETGNVMEAERREVLVGGGERYFRHRTSPVRDRDGSVVQVVEVVEDVTNRRALEAEAAHAGKLSVLGRMAAGIAHEIGNPLSSLSTRLSLLERRSDPAFVNESVDLLRAQVDRISRIVHGVSHFARLRSQGWTVWELNEMVAEAVEMVALDSRAKKVTFSRRLADPSPRARGVRDQILQVTLNLLLNAVEAMPEGGEVIVETSQQEHEIELKVSDTGGGIADDVRARLFEPFFTTKDEGTGLGLSISYSLAHAHGGRIEVDSSSSAGARFAVYLPRARAESSGTEYAELTGERPIA